jgi:hypothetical protein
MLIFVEIYKVMLHAKYLSSGHHSFTQYVLDVFFLYRYNYQSLYK